MKNLIYKNYEKFTTEFLSIAEAYKSKLTFTNREEYLAWVKQWKEDYKLVLNNHVVTQQVWRRDHCIKPEKIAKAEKILSSIPDFTNEQKVRIVELYGKFQSDFGFNKYVCSSHYLIWYLLLARKAAKLKAGEQMAQNKKVLV